MSEKYKIPTTDKEIYDLVKDKVLDSFKKRGLKVLSIAIMDYLKHISEELGEICVYHEVGAKIIENLENSIRAVYEE